mgnify:CR=1 FL=1
MNAVASVSLVLLTLVGNSMSNAIIKKGTRRSHGPIPPHTNTQKAVKYGRLTGSIGDNVEETLLRKVVEEKEKHLLGTAHTITLSPRNGEGKVLAWQPYAHEVCPDLHGIGEVQHEDDLIL